MQILMTADTIGGVWVYALELARALGKHNIEVALATMGGLPSDEQRQSARAISSLELHESSFKLEWMTEPWADVARAGEWLLELEAHVRPSVIHLNGYAHGALSFHAPTMVVGHSCVLSWWHAVKGEAAPSRICQRYENEVARGLHTANLVVAPSQAMLDSLEANYTHGTKLNSKRVIYNGRDPKLFTPGVKEDFIFTAGRLWDEAKNIGALTRVAVDLSWPTYVAGEARHPDTATDSSAEDHAKCHQQADLTPNNVQSLGFLTTPMLAAWLARASIYVLPARYEPFGLSVLEAALAGCALVLGDIPSLREIWEDAAVFVAPGDAPALRSEINALIADTGRRQTLAERARMRALQFTPERMAAEYVAAYAGLLNERANYLFAQKSVETQGEASR